MDSQAAHTIFIIFYCIVVATVSRWKSKIKQHITKSTILLYTFASSNESWGPPDLPHFSTANIFNIYSTICASERMGRVLVCLNLKAGSTAYVEGLTHLHYSRYYNLILLYLFYKILFQINVHHWQILPRIGPNFSPHAL